MASEARMWLHPIHGGEANRRPESAFVPKDYCEDNPESSLGSCLIGVALDVPDGCRKPAPNDMVPCTLREEDATLLIGASTSVQEVVPLEFAEIEYLPCNDGAATAVLSLVLPPPTEDAVERPAWCLVVETLDALLQFLTEAGAGGAIRHDFGAFYDVAHDGVIGSGGFSTVHLAAPVYPEGSAKVAVKAIAPWRTTRARIFKEVATLLAVGRHPNSIAFHGLFRLAGTNRAAAAPDVPEWAVVMARCAHGDLHDAITAAPSIPEPRMLRIFRGVVSALAHIHDLGLVHRDVKAENVLLDGDQADHAVICDFGIACSTRDRAEMTRQCGSPGYAAPELLAQKPYGCEVDNFGAGVILFFGLAGHHPFLEHDIHATLEKNKSARVSFKSKPRMASVSGAAKHLIKCLLKRDPARRISARCALELLRGDA